MQGSMVESRETAVSAHGVVFAAAVIDPPAERGAHEGLAVGAEFDAVLGPLIVTLQKVLSTKSTHSFQWSFSESCAAQKQTMASTET